MANPCLNQCEMEQIHDSNCVWQCGSIPEGAHCITHLRHNVRMTEAVSSALAFTVAFAAFALVAESKLYGNQLNWVETIMQHPTSFRAKRLGHIPLTGSLAVPQRCVTPAPAHA